MIAANTPCNDPNTYPVRDAGQWAFKNGFSLSANPYPVSDGGSSLHREWKKGWLQAAAKTHIIEV